MQTYDLYKLPRKNNFPSDMYMWIAHRSSLIDLDINKANSWVKGNDLSNAIHIAIYANEDHISSLQKSLENFATKIEFAHIWNGSSQSLHPFSQNSPLKIYGGEFSQGIPFNKIISDPFNVGVDVIKSNIETITNGEMLGSLQLGSVRTVSI